MESRSETSDRARALSVFRRQPHNHPSGSRQSCLCRSIGKKTGLRYIRYPSHNSQKPLKFSPSNIVCQYIYSPFLQSDMEHCYKNLLLIQYRPHSPCCTNSDFLPKMRPVLFCSSSFHLWTCTHRQSDIIQ